MKPSEALRRAIRDRGLPTKRVCRMAGVSHATVSKFLNGRGGLTLATLDKLAPHLFVQLQVVEPETVWTGLNATFSTPQK